MSNVRPQQNRSLWKHYMNWLEVAPLITFLGVLVTLLITFLNSRAINKQNRITSMLVETFKAHGQFQMACIDRRLQAHQEAFVFWSKLMKPPSDDEFMRTNSEASIWWDHNCLYLDPIVQQAFLRSIVAAKSHHVLIRNKGGQDSISEHWAEFERFPKVLFEAIKLPPLSSEDLDLIIKRFQA